MPEKRRISFIQHEATPSQAYYDPQDFRFKNDIAPKFTGDTGEVKDKNINSFLQNFAKRMMDKLSLDRRRPNSEHDTILQEEVDEYAQDLLDFCLKLKQKHGDEKEAFVVESLFLENIFLAYNRKNEFGFEHIFPGSTLNPVFNEEGEPTKNFKNFSSDVEIALRRLLAGIIESIKKILNSPEGEKYRAGGVNEVFFAEQFPTFFTPYNPRKSRGLDGSYFIKKGGPESISRIFLEERGKLFEKFEEDSKNGKLPYFVRPPKLMGRDQNAYIAAEEKMSNLGILITKATEIKEENDKKGEKTDFINIDDAITVVAIFTDFVKACQYIEEKGFMLGDIKPNNIGYDTKTKQGFAFDFDAIMKAGSYYPTRLTNVEMGKKYNFNYSPEANTGEIVHQLGQSLDEIFESLSGSTTNNELKNIFQRLIRFGEVLRKDYDRRFNRIKLDRILAELGEIAFELKDLKMRPAE